MASLKLWTHHFRGAQNLDLLWGVILIEICAWRLSFWNPDTDRNLPWQHFIATSTDTIVVLMPCHHSSFSNWKAKKMPKMCLQRVIFFSKKCLALKVVWTMRTMQWLQIDTALSLREGQLGSKCLGHAVIFQYSKWWRLAFWDCLCHIGQNLRNWDYAWIEQCSEIKNKLWTALDPT